MVGGGGDNDPKTVPKTLQWSGHLHNVEHMKEKKQNDFSELGDACQVASETKRRLT